MSNVVVLNVRLAAAQDHAGVAALSGQAEWFGKRIFSTASTATLVAGAVMVLVSDGALSFGDAWISYGFVGVALSILLGAVLTQRAANELATVVATGGPASGGVAGLQRRLNLLGAADLAVLVTVVAAMVFNPTF